MNLYGLDVDVIDTTDQFSFKPRLNDDDYSLSNIKNATIRLTLPTGNYKEIPITNPSSQITLTYQDFYEIESGTYILTLRVTDTSDNLIVFPNLNSIVADVTDSSISIEGNVLSAVMVNDIYNKMKSEVIQGAKGDAATISVGKVTTLDAGEAATVTNSGTTSDATFNFGIPKGEKGDKGDKGDTGATGPQGEQGVQGPKGDTGEAAQLTLGETDIYKPWVLYDSFGKQYDKSWINGSGVESSSNNDVATDYFQCPSNCTIVINTPSLDVVRFTTTQGGPLRLSFYDSNKTHISQSMFKDYPTPGQVTATSPDNTAYARISFNCCDSTTADGTNLRIQCISIGSNHVSMSSTGVNNTLNLNFASSLPGIQGPQGPQGVQGPQGTIGNYVTGTGWLDLTPYMNSSVWCGWDSSNASDLGWCRYAVTSINDQNIFWFRIHSRLKDPTILQTDQTKLFDIPQSVYDQYGSMEWNQFNTNIECGGVPFVASVQKNNTSAWVSTFGYVPVYVGGSQRGLPTGTTTVNFEGWYIL